MPEVVRLVHRVLMDGRFHAYTSPDVAGFNVAMETRADAQREALAVLDLIAQHRGVAKPSVVFLEPEPLPAAAE